MPVSLIKPRILLVRIKTSPDTMEVNLEVSKRNINKKAISLDSAVYSTPLYFPQRFQVNVSKEPVYISHHSTVHVTYVAEPS